MLSGKSNRLLLCWMKLRPVVDRGLLRWWWCLNLWSSGGRERTECDVLRLAVPGDCNPARPAVALPLALVPDSCSWRGTSSRYSVACTYTHSHSTYTGRCPGHTHLLLPIRDHELQTCDDDNNNAHLLSLSTLLLKAAVKNTHIILHSHMLVMLPMLPAGQSVKASGVCGEHAQATAIPSQSHLPIFGVSGGGRSLISACC